MTPVQQALAAGFEASLQARGVLVVANGTVNLTALVTPATPETMPFDVTEGEGESSGLTFGRAELDRTDLRFRIGQRLVEYRLGRPVANHRVRKIVDSGSDAIRVTVLCDTTRI